MMNPRILIDRNIPYISGRLESVAQPIYLSQEEFTPERVRDADALIIRTRTRCDRNLLENSNVRLIVTATIGTDHIDQDYCREKDIEVRNCPGCNAPGVAQYVWSSVLRLGFKPGKHKIGIVGCGNVGTIVAKWGLMQGAEILVSDPPKAKDAAGKDWLPRLKESDNIREASLTDILKECDVVTIHTPLTSTGQFPTHHLINSNNLPLLKPGAILVNAARGEVVDNTALTECIEKRKKNGEEIKTVIDTWEGEPAIDRRLLSLTTIATPHIAGYSAEGKQRATRMAIEAVNDFYGISGDTSALEGGYEFPETLTPEEITASYDPFADDAELKNNPGRFESLRHDYDYRHEPRGKRDE